MVIMIPSFLFLVITGFETENKYEIKNSFGQMIYFAKEDTDCCTRYCFGPARPFTLRIVDNLGQEVITMQRPLRCNSCFFPCCLQEVGEQLQGYFVGSLVRVFLLLLNPYNQIRLKGKLAHKLLVYA